MRNEHAMDRRMAAESHGEYREGILMMKKTLLSLVPLELYKTIKEQADKEQHSVAVMIMVLLEEALRARGSRKAHGILQLK